jgi:hypothetical protein
VAGCARGRRLPERSEAQSEALRPLAEIVARPPRSPVTISGPFKRRAPATRPAGGGGASARCAVLRRRADGGIAGVRGPHPEGRRCAAPTAARVTADDLRLCGASLYEAGRRARLRPRHPEG